MLIEAVYMARRQVCTHKGECTLGLNSGQVGCLIHH